MQDRLPDPRYRYELGWRGFFLSHLHRIQRRLRRWVRQSRLILEKPIGVIGLVIIAFFALMGLAQPLLMSTVWDKATYDPFLGFDAAIESHPSLPSRTHLLGTDYKGRDVLSQLAFATRTSFVVGVMAALIGTIVATLVGVVAAYYEGAVDTILMTLADAFMLLPPAVVLLTVGLIIDMNGIQVGLIYGIFAGLGSLAIMIKSHTLAIKSKQYIQAGRVAGGRHWRIIRIHILPNLLPLLVVNMMFIVTGSVMVEALMSSVSDTLTRFSWGRMIWLIQVQFRGGAVGLQWHVLIPPALAIMLFCGAFYLVGQALDELVNPRLRQK
jgi:peptide/nickel transport system permease protein